MFIQNEIDIAFVYFGSLSNIFFEVVHRSPIDIARDSLLYIYAYPFFIVCFSFALQLVMSFFSNMWTSYNISSVIYYLHNLSLQSKLKFRLFSFLLAVQVLASYFIIVFAFFLQKSPVAIDFFLAYLVISLLFYMLWMLILLVVHSFVKCLSFCFGRFQKEDGQSVVLEPFVDEPAESKRSLSLYDRAHLFVASLFAPTESEDSDDERVEVSLFDPTQLYSRLLLEWASFLHEDRALRLEQGLRGHPPSTASYFVTFAILVVYYALYIAVRATTLLPGDKAFYMSMVAYWLAAPIFVFFNLFAVCSPERRALIARHSLISSTFYLLTALYLFLFVAAIVAGAVFSARLINPPAAPRSISSFAPPHNVSAAPDFAFCRINVAGWSLVEFAAIAMLPQDLEFLLPAFDFNATVIDSDAVVPFVLVRKPAAAPVVAFQSLLSRYQYCFLMENSVHYWFKNIFSIMLPFFRQFYAQLGSTYLETFATLSGNRFVFRLWPELAAAVARFHIGPDPVFVGHAAGGLIAKAMGSLFRTYSVAFDAEQYLLSTLGANAPPDLQSFFKLVNVYAESSFFTRAEQYGTESISLPAFRSFFAFPNPYETFCMVAAGCVSDDTFDIFCNATIGIQRYRDFFAFWNRSRS
jgi:hypothetical protein